MSHSVITDNNPTAEKRTVTPEYRHTDKKNYNNQNNIGYGNRLDTLM